MLAGWQQKVKLFGKLCQVPNFSMSERQQTANCEGQWSSLGLTIMEHIIFCNCSKFLPLLPVSGVGVAFPLK